MNGLEGKVAVITGGSRGFGYAIAKAYLEAGARLVIASRPPASVQEAADQLSAGGDQVIGLPCDVGILEQVRKLAQIAIQAFGGIDIWVNNAGISAPYGPTTGISPEIFTRVVQTNILGT